VHGTKPHRNLQIMTSTTQRIPAVNADTAPEPTKALLVAVAKQMGGVPNILATMAQSRAALDGYLGFAGGLAKGSFSAALREQIALTVAGANACDYCASVHTALGQRAGLSVEETRRNLMGQASDAKNAAVLALARLIVKNRGQLVDSDLTAFHAAGYGSDALVELVANVTLQPHRRNRDRLPACQLETRLTQPGPSRLHPHRPGENP
jgi:AhpD family alkylhydroperoxidase